MTPPFPSIGSQWLHCSYFTDCYEIWLLKYTSMTTCFSFMRSINAGKMYSCSLSCGWKEIKFNVLLQQYTTLLLTSLYVTHVWLVECFQRELALHFTAYLLTDSSTDVNTTVMWWSILPNKTHILESLGEMLDFFLLSYQRGFSELGLASRDIHTECHIPYT
jgi:hypothetical protein